MGIEITRKNDGAPSSTWWYGRFAIDGKSKCVNLGVKIVGRVPKSLKETGDTAFERSRLKAQVKLEELKKEAVSLKTAEHHLKELYEIKAGGGVEQVALNEMEERWELLPAKRKRTAQQVKIQKANLRDFRAFMENAFPQVKYLSQVNRKMALAWIKHLKDLHYSGASHNVKLAVVRGLFDQLGAESGILANPFAGIPYQPLNSVHRQPLTEEELKRILMHADEIIRPVILTGMSTAMRRGDCCLLKWESVDLKNGFITVKTSKTGELAEIPLFPVLREELERRPRAGEHVFPEVAEMYRNNSYGISWRFKQAMKKAKIENTHAQREGTERMASVKDFHSLRTTWITMALTAGVPMELVRRVTGHSTVEVVLKHYFRPGRDAFRNALECAMPALLTQGSAPTAEGPLQELARLSQEAPDMDKAELLKLLRSIADQIAA